MTDEERQECRFKCSEYQIYLCDFCEERPNCVGLALKALAKRMQKIKEEEEK